MACPFIQLQTTSLNGIDSITLRSLNAENQERFSKDIKATTRTTNFHHDHLIVNSLIRLQAREQSALQGKAFQQQENRISKEWNKLPPRPSTVITKAMINENIPGFSAHRKRIVDYLLDECWHEEDIDGNWVFYDGETNLEQRVSLSVQNMHLR